MQKKLPDSYCYPAVLTYEEGQDIAVVFYDIELATSGTDDREALYMARDALGGRLELMEEDGDEIPTPTALADIPLKENQKAVLVDVYMPAVRMDGINKAVKRTVTLPAWLNAKALEYNLNFSQVLQEALKEKLGVA